MLNLKRGFISPFSLILLLVLLLTGALLAKYGLARRQDIRSKAATPAPLSQEEQQYIAGIDANGKISAEKALWIRIVSPKLYEQLGNSLTPEVRAQVDAKYAFYAPAASSPPPVHVAGALLPPQITTCGDISTANTDYKLQNDITTTQGTCLLIHDTHDVSLDCQNRQVSVTPPAPVGGEAAIAVSNVTNFTIKNCTMNGLKQQSPFLVDRGTGGRVESNNINKYVVNVGNSTNITFINNQFNAVYQQGQTSGTVIQGNTFRPDPGILYAGVVILGSGSNNQVLNNTIDGVWDSVVRGSQNDKGADDGVILQDETNDVISDNTILNNWDTGIETLGLVTDSQLTNNTIKNVGVAGIGGWYWNSWQNVKVSNNTIDTAPTSFYIFRVYGLRTQDQFFYFKDNTFTGNKFVNPKNAEFSFTQSAYIDETIDPQVIATAKQLLRNNVFSTNNFGLYRESPRLLPTTMVIDMGDNTCRPSTDPSVAPLQCLAPSPWPTPVPSPSPSPSPSPTRTSTPTPIPSPSPSPTIRPSASPTATPCVKVGDFDNDCEVGIIDLSFLLGYYRAGDLRADLNHDGRISIGDVSVFASNFGR